MSCIINYMGELSPCEGATENRVLEDGASWLCERHWGRYLISVRANGDLITRTEAANDRMVQAIYSKWARVLEEDREERA